MNNDRDFYSLSIDKRLNSIMISLSCLENIIYEFSNYMDLTRGKGIKISELVNMMGISRKYFLDRFETEEAKKLKKKYQKLLERIIKYSKNYQEIKAKQVLSTVFTNTLLKKHGINDEELNLYDLNTRKIVSGIKDRTYKFDFLNVDINECSATTFLNVMLNEYSKLVSEACILKREKKNLNKNSNKESVNDYKSETQVNTKSVNGQNNTQEISDAKKDYLNSFHLIDFNESKVLETIRNRCINNILEYPSNAIYEVGVVNYSYSRGYTIRPFMSLIDSDLTIEEFQKLWRAQSIKLENDFRYSTIKNSSEKMDNVDDELNKAKEALRAYVSSKIFEKLTGYSLSELYILYKTEDLILENVDSLIEDISTFYCHMPSDINSINVHFINERVKKFVLDEEKRRLKSKKNEFLQSLLPNNKHHL